MSTEISSGEFRSPEHEFYWPRMLLFPAISVVGFIGFVTGFGGDSLFVHSLWACGLGYCWFFVSGSFHETVHQTLGRNPTANVIYGRILGTFLGIPYTAYRESHIRHHAYLNTAEDYELWPYSRPSRSLAFRRAFVLFEIVFAVLAGPVVYGRIYFKQGSPISDKKRATIGREYMAIAAFWGLITLTIISLTLTGAADWKQFNLMWILPLPIAATMNTFRKFVEHLGMSSTDPLLGTRTILGNGLLTRLSSYFNFEEFVHGPHHRFPKVPHFELGSRLEQYQEEHPEQKIPVFTTYRAAVWDMLPSLWYPGVGENAFKIEDANLNADMIPIDKPKSSPIKTVQHRKAA